MSNEAVEEEKLKEFLFYENAVKCQVEVNGIREKLMILYTAGGSKNLDFNILALKLLDYDVDEVLKILRKYN